ncbi:MAG: N-formylglutamate amidohydrolase [Cyanobacteria bacterium J06629_19]
MPTDLFEVHRPIGTALPIIANLPHSGLQVPAEIAACFTEKQRRSLPNSDWHLQELYDFLPALGITVMQANYSRYVVDLNRALKVPFFGSFWSAVVPEQTAFKQEIYTQKPTKSEVRSRIDQYYTPYHAQLTALLNDAIAHHGKVYLLDLHSFMGLIDDDVCLGNAKGESCSQRTLDIVEAGFLSGQFQTVKNKVFTGGYITRHYGEYDSVEALQIELRYTNYLPDDQLEIEEIPQWQGPKFAQAKDRLKLVFGSIADLLE